jgi:hypothetical protein
VVVVVEVVVEIVVEVVVEVEVEVLVEVLVDVVVEVVLVVVGGNVVVVEVLVAVIGLVVADVDVGAATPPVVAGHTGSPSTVQPNRKAVLTAQSAVRPIAEGEGRHRRATPEVCRQVVTQRRANSIVRVKMSRTWASSHPSKKWPAPS